MAVDDRYAGSAVLVVTVEFENIRVPARNKIPVRESVGEAEPFSAPRRWSESIVVSGIDGANAGRASMMSCLP